MNSRLHYPLVVATFLIAAFASTLYFGNHERGWKDASEYDAYATNMLTHGLYSEDGVHFDPTREPGYPVFLALIYGIFGLQNFDAVSAIQATLFGILGLLLYLFFSKYGTKSALAVGLCISAFPLYTFYATEILTEPLFIFLLGLIFLVCAKLIEAKNTASLTWYLLLGTLCGYESLVRIQFLFFLPLILIAATVVWRSFSLSHLKYMAAALLTFSTIIGSWVLFVHAHTGTFAITEGRQERTLNERAVRTQLSYGELTRYGIAWLERSIRNGHYDPFLDSYEWKHIDAVYNQLATSSEVVAAIRSKNIHILLSRPGQYLYGNVIEIMKLLYIEHDFTDSQSRYLRPVIYTLVYLFTLFGLTQMLRKGADPEMRQVGLLAVAFIAYNCAIVSFFDAIPRYNTPYMMFFIMIGFAGILIWKRKGANG